MLLASLGPATNGAHTNNNYMDITVTIDRIEGDKAVLITQDKEAINWPKDKLPQKAREGTVLEINIIDTADKTNDNKQLAKNILNEILTP